MAGRDPNGTEPEPHGPALDAADEPMLRELAEMTVRLELLVDRIEELADGLSHANERESRRS